MMLSIELRECLKRVRRICVHECWNRCGQLLGAVRYTHFGQPDVWCNRQCRDGAAAHSPGTCKACKAKLPKGKRRGAIYCDDACKQAAPQVENERTTVSDAEIIRNESPDLRGFFIGGKGGTTCTPFARIERPERLHLQEQRYDKYRGGRKGGPVRYGGGIQ